MRWVFLSLICLNLITMLWFWKVQEDQPVTDKKQSVNSSSVPSLTLLGEADAGDLVQRFSKSNGQVREARRCYSVGPMKDRIDAKHVKARAEALGFESAMRSLSTGSLTEHWVHIPPLPDRQAALQLFKELQGRKIDSYVVTQGELAEAISLGLFRNIDSATQLKSRMDELGYTVEIREVKRGAKELWLEFPQIAQLTEVMRNRVVGESEGLEWALTDCSS